jgi:transcriptional regulator with XRE-family HTH domain
MYWNFGTVYKTVRQGKGLTQEYVSNGILSRSNLSRIENQNQMPTLETMHLLLERLNVSMDEFGFICKQYHEPEREGILNDFKKINWNGDKTAINSFILRCEKFLKKGIDGKIAELKSIAEAQRLIYRDGIVETKSTSAEIVWKRLCKIDVYTLDDLKTLNQILFVFPHERVKIIMPQVREALDMYKDYPASSNVRLNLLCNIAYLYMIGKDFKEALDYLRQAERSAKRYRYYDYLGTVWVRQGICNNNEDLMAKGLRLIESAEDFDLKSALEDEISRFI